MSSVPRVFAADGSGAGLVLVPREAGGADVRLFELDLQGRELPRWSARFSLVPDNVLVVPSAGGAAFFLPGDLALGEGPILEVRGATGRAVLWATLRDLAAQAGLPRPPALDWCELPAPYLAPADVLVLPLDEATALRIHVRSGEVAAGPPGLFAFPHAIVRRAGEVDLVPLPRGAGRASIEWSRDELVLGERTVRVSDDGRAVVVLDETAAEALVLLDATGTVRAAWGLGDLVREDSQWQLTSGYGCVRRRTWLTCSDHFFASPDEFHIHLPTGDCRVLDLPAHTLRAAGRPCALARPGLPHAPGCSHRRPRCWNPFTWSFR